MAVIHVQWEGPLAREEVLVRGDPVKDRGVYQIYGSHPVYGLNTLLYIGRTSGKFRTFSARIGEHDWRLGRDLAQGEPRFFLGRLAGSVTPDDSAWREQIETVEVLLVAAHKPSWNSASVLDLGPERERQIGDAHVLNWGVFGVLLPEVSAARWTLRLADVPGYHIYSSQGGGS